MAGKRVGLVSSCVALLMILGSTIGCSAAMIRDGDPGTIGEALTKADGATVTLPAEQVMWRGRSGKSFAIREWFEKLPDQPRLIVVSTRPLPVDQYWTVDVTGTLGTFPETTDDGNVAGQRVLIVSPENVAVYCDPKGRPFMFLPIKGHEQNWRDKCPLPALAGTPTVASMSAMSLSTMSGGTFPTLSDSPYSGPPPPPAPGSRDTLKWLPDGAPVSISNAVVSAAFGGWFYVEKTDRSFGIRVSSPDYVYAGQLVDIAGQMSTGGGERCVVAKSGDVVVVDDTNTYPIPIPLGMANKQLGGGPVGMFTPAVAGRPGVNNTGLLARAWGKVTDTSFDNNYYCSVFYIDDGSGLAADLTDPTDVTSPRYRGVKVYDTTWDPLPDTGSYQVITGVSSAEVPPGLSTSIRALWKVTPTIPDIQTGSGTISGTVTATGASGVKVHVFCDNASAVATLSGGTANYTLHVTAGSHAVTASVLGNKTVTCLVTVTNGQVSTQNFALTAIQRVIDVVVAPSRIPPDGSSQMTITAIVRDAEGRRFGNEPVLWNFDLGTFISADSTTDAVGEARLILQAPSTPGTANVSVTVGGTTAVNYAEFASPTAPYVRILAPTLNQTVSGFATIDLQAADPGGANRGVVQLGVIVDGQPLASVGFGSPTIAWSTCSLSNGAHTIRAAASDGDLEYGYSQAVTVTVSNPIHNLSVSRTLFNTQDPTPGNRSTIISAAQDQALPWTVTFTKRGATSPSRTYSGTGSAISVTWDGKDDSGNATSPGQYSYNITSSGGSSFGWVEELSASAGPTTALLVEGASLPNSDDCLTIVEDACEARGFRVVTLRENDATWENFQYYMMVYQPEVLYVKTHGSYEIRTGVDASPGLLPQVSQFMLKDSSVYAYRPQDNQGHWYPEYPAAGRPAYANIPVVEGNLYWPQMTAHYVSELGFKSDWSPLKLVWMDSCMDGRIGSAYGNLTSMTNPYAIDYYSTGNDLASEFGIYQNASTIGASLCGYYELAFADDGYRDFLARVFGSMKVGYSLDQAITRDAWNERPKHTALYPGGIDMYYGPSPGFPLWGAPNPCNNWRVPMPPYHNLRVHGNPYSTYLRP